MLTNKVSRPTADQYSAAATIYHLLTGSRIYEPSNSTAEVLTKILTTEPIPLRENATPLAEPFGSVICKALTRDPEKRFPNIRAMRQSLIV